MDDTSVGSLEYDQAGDVANGNASVGGNSVRSRFSTGPRGDGGDGMDALAAFASLAARNESITLDDPEPLGQDLDHLSNDGSRRSRRQTRPSNYFQDDDEDNQSRKSTSSRKRKSSAVGGNDLLTAGSDFLNYDDDDSLAGLSTRSMGGGGGGKRSASRQGLPPPPQMPLQMPPQAHLTLPQMQQQQQQLMMYAHHMQFQGPHPQMLDNTNVPMLLGSANNPVMAAAARNRRGGAAAAARKPTDDSKADGSAPARALVNDRWAENPRLTMLVNSLSSRMRHFAMFEWFYSTIDRDYFNHNEFQDCLDHLDLRHITKLTRTEWSAFRSALGRPRRLSSEFLREERVKLESYRRVIRDVQRRAIPTPPTDFGYEVPVPIVVGQNVSAYHKRAKLLSRGQVLTADYERGVFRVQFERPELGSEVCSDTELAVHGAPSLLFARPQPRPGMEEPFLQAASLPFLPQGALAGDFSASGDTQDMGGSGVQGMLPIIPGLSQQPSGSLSVSHQNMGPVLLGAEELAVVQAKLLAFTTKMLERKEALLSALRDLNGQADSMGALASGARHPSLYSTPFRQQYAWVVAALTKTNAALNPALEKLRLTVFADAQLDGSGQEPAGEADVHFGVRVPIHVKTLLEASQRAAKVLVHSHKSNKGWHEPWPGGEEGRKIEILIEACTSLILVLRRCAEQIRMNSLSPADVDPCLKAALQEIRIRAAGSQRLLSEIESSVALLKSDLVG